MTQTESQPPLSFFPEINGKLGFGPMRLPMIGDAVDPEQTAYYTNELTKDAGKASACITCGRCADICPQHLNIPALLLQAVEAFEA